MPNIEMRYGINPNQTPARIIAENELPFKILNGSCSYINFLDAFNSWQLVKELRNALNLPAATSFKHVSPAGAAVYAALSPELISAYHLEGVELSELAVAYARARGGDRVASFGDFVALSDIVDVPTAKLLKREVSDGVIAPGFEPQALEILKAKKNGGYIVIEMDPAYEPPIMEQRVVYGITMEQRRNDLPVSLEQLNNVVTANKELPDNAKRDLIVALVTLKYTQSNSVCYALDGQTIGVGAGQQSRILCTRLAAQKASYWRLRQHPVVLNMKFREKISRTDMDNAIDQYLQGEDVSFWGKEFTEIPHILTPEEKQEWLSQLTNVSLGSDGFIPFRDNIDYAAKFGVKYIAQPGGSNRDENVIGACDEYGIAMACTGARLFHH